MRPFHHLLAAFTILTLTLATAAEAGTTLVGKPRVAFHAVGSPGFLSIEGVTRTLTLDDDGERLRFVVPMDTVRTGISLRDQHMRDKFVEVDKYPDVVLAFAKGDVQWPSEPGTPATGRVKADFTAHGVTRPVEVSYTIEKAKVGWKVDAEFPFDVTDHGIAIPSYLTVTVNPAMRATISVGLLDGD